VSTGLASYKRSLLDSPFARLFRSVFTHTVGVSPEEGLWSMLSDGANVLHIRLNIMEIRGIPTLHGLGATAAALARRLASPQSGVRPIVILDTPRPFSDGESFEVLLARNRFAQQLAESGTVEAVLATGLGTETEQKRIHDILLEAFRTRASLEETCHILHQASGSIAYRTTALFACNPAAMLS
jgi:hypothetical protein